MKSRNILIIQQILIGALLFLTYSPIISAGASLLDDIALIKGVHAAAGLDFRALFLPDLDRIVYYRPLPMASFHLSRILWEMNPHAMHLENLLFHLVNALLLFHLIRLSLPEENRTRLYLPFAGSLLFALHPVATESVSWISGRTDLIAGAFLTAATTLIVFSKSASRKLPVFIIAFLLLLAASLSKEAAWGFWLIIPFFALPPHDAGKYPLSRFFKLFTTVQKLLLIAAAALSFLLPPLLHRFWPSLVTGFIIFIVILCKKPRERKFPLKFFIFLAAAFASLFPLVAYLSKIAGKVVAGNFYSSTSRTILLISTDPDNSIALFLAAAAFYLKKFFLPLPLSSAITDISNGYLFGGIAVILFIFSLAAWRSLPAILFLAGFALLLPSLPLIYDEISWTAYAERYVYIPSIFWTAAISIALGRVCSRISWGNATESSSAVFDKCDENRKTKESLPDMTRSPLPVSPSNISGIFAATENIRKRRLLQALSIAIFTGLALFSALSTFNRATVWQSNVTLFGDAVRKAPEHIRSRVLYMTALCEAGRLQEALDQFRSVAKTSGNRNLWLRYVYPLAEKLYLAGLSKEAQEVISTTAEKAEKSGIKPSGEDWEKLQALSVRLKK